MNTEKEENRIIVVKLPVLFQELKKITALPQPEELLIYRLLHALHWEELGNSFCTSKKGMYKNKGQKVVGCFTVENWFLDSKSQFGFCTVPARTSQAASK